MSRGLAAAINLMGEEVWKGAYPGKKIVPLGYIQYLLSNAKPNVISDGKDDGSGYIRDVKIRYMQRSVGGKSTTVDDCLPDIRTALLSMDVPATSFRKLGMAFEDDLIARFEKDALAMMNVGTPSTPIMKEVWDAIISVANGLFIDINNDLLTYQAAQFGVNIATGVNTAKTVNFALNGTNNNLNAGMTSVMADAMTNEMSLAGSSVVGSGLILNYMLQQPAKSADQAGLDTSRLLRPDWKYDPYAQAAWGVDNFALFENNAVQFVNICRFRGAKAGTRGRSYFFTLRLPIEDSIGQGNYREFEFDVQLIYRDCPEDVQIGAFNATTNPPTALGRGWNVILMSSYQQVNIPTDAYASTDRLYGNNGTYLFHATNS